MPWQCKLVDREAQIAAGQQPTVGDMWFLPSMLSEDGREFSLAHLLSAEYQRDWLDKRDPICVVLPCDSWFIVDSQCNEGPLGNPAKRGWTVTGEAPNITVSPSINAVGRYHGWLQNGVLSEDVEGRIFQPKLTEGKVSGEA